MNCPDVEVNEGGLALPSRTPSQPEDLLSDKGGGGGNPNAKNELSILKVFEINQGGLAPPSHTLSQPENLPPDKGGGGGSSPTQQIELSILKIFEINEGGGCDLTQIFNSISYSSSEVREHSQMASPAIL